MMRTAAYFMAVPQRLVFYQVCMCVGLVLFGSLSHALRARTDWSAESVAGTGQLTARPSDATELKVVVTRQSVYNVCRLYWSVTELNERALWTVKCELLTVMRL